MADTGVTNWPASDDLDLPSDMDTRAPTSAGDGNYTFEEWLERVTGILRAVYNDLNVGKVADLPMGSHKITGLADGSSPADAVNRGQLDAILVGVKAPVRVATTANITLSGAQTIDGVSVVAGDRVLVKDQSTGSENGIYVAASGAWVRSTDADASAEVKGGLIVWVNEGTSNGDTAWALQTNDPIVVGSTSLVFVQSSGLGQVTAGAGLSKAGNTINAVANADGSMQVNADDLQVADLGITTAKLAASAVTSAKADGSIEKTANKGAASGYSGLDASKLVIAQIGRAAPWKPTAQESMPRHAVTNLYTQTAGKAVFSLLYLRGGVALTKLGACSDTIPLTAGGTPHLWFALADLSRNLLCATADDTAPVWGANAGKSATITRDAALGAIASYTPPADGYYYGVIMQNVGTPATLAATLMRGVGQGMVAAGATALGATSADVGLAADPPTTFGALTALTTQIYFWAE